MRQVFTSVQPQQRPADQEQHPRAGQAGIVCHVPADKPDEVGVRWDSDNAITAEKVSDLKAL